MIIYADGAIWEVPDDILIYVHEEQEEEEQMETKALDELIEKWVHKDHPKNAT